MNQPKWGSSSTEHEEAHHAASRCGAASFPLTERGSHDQKRICLWSSQQAGPLASQTRVCLSCSWSMGTLSGQEDGALIAHMLAPGGKDDAYPLVREGTHSFRM